MMRASVLAAVLAALTSGAAAAQPIETALLPDGDGRARLVLAHWPSGGWVVSQQGRQVDLRFPGIALAIDLGALDISSGDWPGWVSAISTQAGDTETRLRLDLACECGVALTGDREARLAIDIIGPGLKAGPVLRASGPAPARAPVPPPRGGRRVARAGLTEDMPPELAATRARLIAQLERAAEAGLITMEPDPSADEQEPGLPETADVIEPGPADPALGGPETGPSPAGDARDPERRGPPPPDPGTATAAPQISDPEIATGLQSCPSDAELEVAQPLQGQPFLDRLAALRSTLLGEFDHASPEAAHALAQFYIAHEMAAEAQATLAVFAPEDSRTERLLALAAAVSGAPQETAAAGWLDCEGLARLWGALAAVNQGNSEAAARFQPEIRAVLETQPEPLRSRLAVRLGLAAASEEAWTAARAYRSLARRADRAGTAPSPSRRLLDVLIANTDQDPLLSIPALRQLWADGGPEGAEAMLLLAGMVADGQVPGVADTHLLRLDLGALALERRGTDLAKRAFEAELHLRAKALGRASAVDLLSLGLTESTVTEAEHAKLIAQLGAHPDPSPDEAPLAVLHGRSPERYERALADPGFRRALARSYTEIGLPARAEDLAAPEDLADVDFAARLAKAYLSAGRAADARRIAQRLPKGPKTAEVLALAVAASGQPGEALAILREAEAGTSAERARLAWAAGDWPAAATALGEIEAESPSPETAARLAIARARSTAAEAGADPASFQPVAEDEAPSLPAADAASVADYLSLLRSETAMMKEMLADG